MNLLTIEDCLDHGTPPNAEHGNSPCSGTVEYRMPLSGTGRSFPRCERHWEARLVMQEQNEARYPQTAPSDFDPAHAGECWDEDY